MANIPSLPITIVTRIVPGSLSTDTTYNNTTSMYDGYPYTFSVTLEVVPAVNSDDRISPNPFNYDAYHITEGMWLGQTNGSAYQIISAATPTDATHIDVILKDVDLFNLLNDSSISGSNTPVEGNFGVLFYLSDDGDPILSAIELQRANLPDINYWMNDLYGRFQYRNLLTNYYNNNPDNLVYGSGYTLGQLVYLDNTGQFQVVDSSVQSDLEKAFGIITSVNEPEDGNMTVKPFGKITGGLNLTGIGAVGDLLYYDSTATSSNYLTTTKPANYPLPVYIKISNTTAAFLGWPLTTGVSGTSGGASGSSGSSGESGTSGIDGTSGSSGFSGTSGLSGVNGIDGTSGISGSSGESGTSGIDGANGITAGQVYYFNESQSSDVSPYKVLSREPAATSQQSILVTTTGTTPVLVQEFITPELGFSVIPGGTQRFHTHFLKSGAGFNTDTFVTIELADSAGVGYGTILQTNQALIGWISNIIPVEVTVDLTLPTTTINPTDRMIVKIYVVDQSNGNHGVTWYTEGTQNYSFVLTSTGVMGGTSGSSGYSFNWVGVWDGDPITGSTISYGFNDVVYYNGTSYIYTNLTPSGIGSIPPDSNTAWSVMTISGSSGLSGSSGSSGESVAVTGLTLNGTLLEIQNSDSTSASVDLDPATSSQSKEGLTTHGFAFLDETMFTSAQPFHSFFGGVSSTYADIKVFELHEVDLTAKTTYVVLDVVETGSTFNYVVILPLLTNDFESKVIKFVTKRNNLNNLNDLLVGSKWMSGGNYNRIIATNIKTRLTDYGYFFPLETMESIEILFDGYDWLVVNTQKQQYIQANPANYLLDGTNGTVGSYKNREIDNLL
jgi:hypothetical protein